MFLSQIIINKEGRTNLLEVIGMFVVLSVVLVSWIYQVVHIKCVQLFVGQSHLYKAVLKYVWRAFDHVFSF